jgi:pimeloyl-ACP methyl ester carboxylesterase
MNDAPLPVVLLHAFPLSAAMWQPQLEALGRQFRLITPDLRGFGSRAGQTGSLAEMADDVAAMTDGPVVLGGLSMGGYVALAFFRKYAERVRALILADTKAEADDATGKANRDKMIAFAETHTAREVIDSVMPKMAIQPRAIEQIRALASAQSTAGIVNAVRAMRDRPDSTDLLPKINVPTLVIVGSDDALTPPALAQRLADRIAGARLEVIPAAGHISNLDNPTAFNRSLQSFLASLPLS